MAALLASPAFSAAVSSCSMPGGCPQTRGRRCGVGGGDAAGAWACSASSGSSGGRGSSARMTGVDWTRDFGGDFLADLLAGGLLTGGASVGCGVVAPTKSTAILLPPAAAPLGGATVI